MSIEPSEDRTTMDCGELARSAEALLDGEFEERERAEAAAHLAVCERCRKMVESLEQTRRAIRRKLRSALGPTSPLGRAPPGLRERVSQALDRERLPLWQRALAPLPVAAAVACAAGAALVLYTHAGGDALAEESVLGHARALPLEITASVGPESVLGWFKGKVDFNARPPDFREADLQLLGGRISHIQDRPAAYMRYQMPQGQLGLFIVEDPDGRWGRGGRTVQFGNATVHLVNARGYNVAVWRKNEIVYSLVSDLREPDLERLVQTALVAPR